MSAVTTVLNLCAVLSLVVLACLFQRHLARRRRWQWRSALIGATTFAVGARVLEPLALHAAGVTQLIVQPGAAAWWLVPVLAATAALFEEFSRLVGLAVTRQRPAESFGLVWSFAAGYAFAELLLIGIMGHSQLLWLAQGSASATALIQGAPPEIRAILERNLAAVGPASAVWLLTERLAACAFHVLLTLLVVASMDANRKGRALSLFLAALALHFVIDLPAAAYQAGVASLWLTELIYALTGLVAMRCIHIHWRSDVRNTGEALQRCTTA